MFRIFLTVWAVSLATLLTACSNDGSYEPNRPSNVPEQAMWIGGIDGGAWVLLEKGAGLPKHIYHAKIYGDQVGDEWYIGRLAVSPKLSPSVPLDDASAYSVWDGDNLLLQDGREMKSIDAFDPFSKSD